MDPWIRRVRISRRVEGKIWVEHHVRPEEVEQVLYDDEEMEIYPGRSGQADFVVIGRTHGGRRLFIAFYFRKGIADVATAFQME